MEHWCIFKKDEVGDIYIKQTSVSKCIKVINVWTIDCGSLDYVTDQIFLSAFYRVYTSQNCSQWALKSFKKAPKLQNIIFI